MRLLTLIIGLTSAGPLFAQTPRFQFERTGGDQAAQNAVTGTWEAITDEGIEIRTDSGVETILFTELASVRPEPPLEAIEGPPQRITLVGGSVLSSQELATTDDESINIILRRQPDLKVPLRFVRSIRFRRGTATSDPQWLGLTEQENRSDVMVIRRGNDQLDPIEGVIVALDTETLDFNLDGDIIEAPIERLEGVVFRTTGGEANKNQIKITGRYGSQFFIDRLQSGPVASEISVDLPGETTHRIPIDQLREITWSSGRVMLAQEQPADSGYKPYLTPGIEPGLFKKWFEPRSEGSDLVASAGGSIEYRIDDGFQSLIGSVAREESVAATSKVIVRIELDENVAWEQKLDGSRRAVGFQIPVTDSRRVRFRVLAGDDGDVGDTVRFFQPRLLK
ncbi:MAG: NPCBM/NEW2 domain-containing protein [Planctomycetota bacterium]